MKRAGRLFDQVLEWHNLRQALSLALRGKRSQPEARRFACNSEQELRKIRDELAAGDFAFGTYHQFLVHDPKERVITAPIFRERVAQHALMNVCSPVFERWLIDDTYACRVGRGRIVAVLRARQYSQRFDHCLKLDIRKYFDSISHRELLERLERVYKDRRLLEAFARIVTSFRGGTGVGLPIGSLTSQYFANFYLGWCDRAVKQRWRVRGYVRYMDDMLLWSDSKSTLHDVRCQLIDFLADELQLAVKSEPYLNRTDHGVDFLGCRVYRNRVTLNRRSRVRYRRKLSALAASFRDGQISEDERQQRETALVSFATAAGVESWQFRRQVLELHSESGHQARTG